MKEKQRFLLALTIWTWIIGTIIGVLFVFVMLNDLSGLEWFGTPTFGMVILILLITSFYLIFRKKKIQPTIIVIIWFFFLFLATAISMIAFAYTNLGQWEDFQSMPLMGTFFLVLWAAGIHFSLMDKQRKPLYILTLWTVILFLTIVITMIALGFGLFGNWEEWQYYPIIGFGIWAFLVTIAYFIIKTPTISWIDAGFYWSWSMFIGITTSMLSVFIVLLNYAQLWPFYPIAGTLGFAILFTTLRVFMENSTVSKELKE
ncbi:MAG: hypothetical protein H7641_05055 [Candidatus Heimdallarchaeota archaeon]|nr:hypothetical protein [Candidatus Heimdallarchaeota archaeon]MCK4876928.1 hypothetical protein [Candidatus Heimdallarchaeota archaeon]